MRHVPFPSLVLLRSHARGDFAIPSGHRRRFRDSSFRSRRVSDADQLLVCNAHFNFDRPTVASRSPIGDRRGGAGRAGSGVVNARRRPGQSSHGQRRQFIVFRRGPSRANLS